MSLNASNLSTNLLVTVCVALFVVLMPWCDRRVCRKLGIRPGNDIHGFSREERLLRLRMLVLYAVLFIYLCANVYLTFFSRQASEDYLIHVDPLNDLINSVNIDSGILGMLTAIYTEGLSVGFSHVHIEKPEDIAQIYMNVMLYVPLGYLLPYVFAWCRVRAKARPVFICLLFSFLTENLQLIFKRGFYDIDDLLSNVLGGLIGQLLYFSLAYVVTHPDWRKELRATRRWRRGARRQTLYPFANKIGLARTTLVVVNEATIQDFYVKTLGFRPIKQILHTDCPQTEYLMQIGSFQLEAMCPGCPMSVGEQYLNLSVKNITKVQHRLEKKGLKPGKLETDPYTGQRCLRINAPEGVKITFIEG